MLAYPVEVVSEKIDEVQMVAAQHGVAAVLWQNEFERAGERFHFVRFVRSITAWSASAEEVGVALVLLARSVDMASQIFGGPGKVVSDLEDS